MGKEKDKMLTGQYYNPYVEPLVSERAKARALAHAFSQTAPDEQEKRRTLLNELLGKADGSIIEPPFRCDYGYNIELGRNFYANFGCVMLDCARIQIGDHVLLGPGVHLYTPIHPLKAEERLATRGLQRSEPIVIGHNVWLGGGVIVCPGVTIGHNTTIGAGSVVTKDIPDNVFAAGNPCRVIKTIE